MNMDSKNNLREKLKESTREAILEAAVSIIIGKSGDVRMEDIAEKAGVAIGTLYNYFDNRQVLIDTIIEKRRNMADSYIRQSLEQTEGQNVCARLENLFQTVFSFLSKHRSVTHHALKLKELNVSKNGNKTLMHVLTAHVEEILGTALERNEISAEYKDIYPIVISGFLSAIFAMVEDGQDEKQHAGMARKMAELFINGAAEKEQRISACL